MEPRRPRWVHWIEWHVLPFVEDHPLGWNILFFGSVFVLGTVIAMFHDGPGAFLNRFGALLATFWWVGLLPFAWWAGDLDIRYHRARIERLRQNHLCIYCGYDLRASADRCPECGKPIDGPPDPS